MIPISARPLVLVADDEPEHAEIVAMLLMRRGFDVQVVHSASEVVERAMLRTPAVVLLDVYMPGDGVVAAARLRGERRTAAVPIVLVTASPNDRVLRARDALEVVVLEKPFHTAELLWAVEVALASRVAEGRA